MMRSVHRRVEFTSIRLEMSQSLERERMQRLPQEPAMFGIVRVSLILPGRSGIDNGILSETGSGRERHSLLIHKSLSGIAPC